MEQQHCWLICISYPRIPYADQNLKPYLKAEIHHVLQKHNFKFAFQDVDSVYDTDIPMSKSNVMNILAELNQGPIVSEYKKRTNGAFKLAIKYYQITSSHRIAISGESHE